MKNDGKKLEARPRRRDDVTRVFQHVGQNAKRVTLSVSHLQLKPGSGTKVTQRAPRVSLVHSQSAVVRVAVAVQTSTRL